MDQELLDLSIFEFNSPKWGWAGLELDQYWPVPAPWWSAMVWSYKKVNLVLEFISIWKFYWANKFDMGIFFQKTDEDKRVDDIEDPNAYR